MPGPAVRYSGPKKVEVRQPRERPQRGQPTVGEKAGVQSQALQRSEPLQAVHSLVSYESEGQVQGPQLRQGCEVLQAWVPYPGVRNV